MTEQIPKYRIIVISFFLVFLCVGLIAFKDYGISWDELVSRNNGLLTYKYVFEGDQELLTYRDRYYGTAFETLLLMIEKAIGFDDPRGIFLFRHLATFLLFYASVIFFYFLCKYRFRDWKMGLLGALFLVLSPRIFAHSFYNSKDLAFLFIFIISVFSLVKYLEKKSFLRAVLHAFICAFLIDTRILGILIPGFTVLFFAFDLFMDKDEKKAKALITFSVYVVMLVSFTVLFWPVLWISPVRQFITAFKQMSRFHFWSTVLYLGEYIKAKNLPWHYIPV
ncbi:MAG: STT3 domain-containing protein, partial [Candidatus Omnitrophota bacterium]